MLIKIGRYKMKKQQKLLTNPVAFLLNKTGVLFMVISAEASI
jgi:hypothetical protein